MYDSEAAAALAIALALLNKPLPAPEPPKPVSSCRCGTGCYNGGKCGEHCACATKPRPEGEGWEWDKDGEFWWRYATIEAVPTSIPARMNFAPVGGGFVAPIASPRVTMPTSPVFRPSMSTQQNCPRGG